KPGPFWSINPYSAAGTLPAAATGVPNMSRSLKSLPQGQPFQVEMIVPLGGFGTAVTPDGRVAIVFQTLEGPIAFEVDERAIDALRREIAVAESFLRPKSGNA